MEGSSKQFGLASETTSDEVKTTELGDLIDGCLVKVFWYLDIDDLVNIVVYDSRFKAAAEQVFRRKLRQNDEPIFVSNLRKNFYNLDKLNHSVQLLNIFGHLLTNICINFKLENVDYLLDAIKRNCREKVTKLEFNHLYQTRQKLYIHERGTQSINQFLKHLSQQLPCLRELSLVYESNDDDCPYWYDVNEIVIPSTTHFSINGRFPYDTFRRFAAVNPQIESLAITVQFRSVDVRHSEEEFIQLLDNALPQLQSLQMSVPQYFSPDERAGRSRQTTVEVPTGYFRNLKMFASTGHLFSTWKPNFRQFAGNQLEELELNHFICSSLTFLDEIRHFKKLKRITIEDSRYYDDEKRVQFENDVNAALANDEPIKIIVRDKPIQSTVNPVEPRQALRANLQSLLERFQAATNRAARF